MKVQEQAKQPAEVRRLPKFVVSIGG